MGFVQEFKEFAIKGNVVDLAVAVIIGGAFGKIVSSFVDDVVTPMLLNPALKAAGVSNVAELTWGTVKYGSFLSAVINFFFIAMVMFMMIIGIIVGIVWANKVKRKHGTTHYMSRNDASSDLD